MLKFLTVVAASAALFTVTPSASVARPTASGCGTSCCDKPCCADGCACPDCATCCGKPCCK